MSILFMGGTGFIGPHMVRALRERGHELTLFNRGKTNPQLFPGLEHIQGDRLTDDISQLRGRKWDVVIDTSAYFPRAVDSLLAELDLDSLRQYVFVSTISVYANFGTPGIDEGAPKEALPEPADRASGSLLQENSLIQLEDRMDAERSAYKRNPYLSGQEDA